MKILNLYAGIGGNRTLWSRKHNVTSVENNVLIAEIYKKRFPNDLLIVDDVEEVIKNQLWVNDYDFIWTSPPCITHSQMQKFNKSVMPIPRMDEIYGLKIWFDWNYNGKYVIENVQPFYKALIAPNARIDRHIFWSNFNIRSIRFREKRKGHGKLSHSHIMRDNIDILMEVAMLNDVKDDLFNLSEKMRMKIIRNCVDPNIGLYILEQLRKNTLVQTIL